jgi:hypothetical protein
VSSLLRRQIRRSEMARFFGKLAPTRIRIEACGASHHWARVLRGLGHEVVLLPTQYIKPYAIAATKSLRAWGRPPMDPRGDNPPDEVPGGTLTGRIVTAAFRTPQQTFRDRENRISLAANWAFWGRAIEVSAVV